MRITARRLLPIGLGLMVVALVSTVLVVVGFAGSAAATPEEFWGILLLVAALVLATSVVAVGLCASTAALILRSTKIKRLARRSVDRLLNYADREAALRRVRAAPGAQGAGKSTHPAETTLLARVEAAERRLLATSDTAHLATEDRLSAIEVRLEEYRAGVKHGQEDLVNRIDEHGAVAKRGQAAMRRHTTDLSRDSVRQVEALLQLLPRVDTTEHRFPPSGGFAMNAEGLLWLTDLIVKHQPARILEVGSGVSSSWMAEFVRRYGGSMVSVDHLDEYASRTRSEVEARGLQNTVDVRLSPLRSVSIADREFQWYSPETFEDLQDVNLLVVDGPPQATGEDARYPALPLLADRLAPGCLVVMDDFNRPDERRIVEDWLQQFPEFEVVETFNDRIGMIRRRG